MVHVSEKVGVRQVYESGGIVRHGIELPRDERELIKVAVLALVKSAQLAEVGRHTVGGSGALGITGQRRCVVRWVESPS